MTAFEVSTPLPLPFNSKPSGRAGNVSCPAQPATAKPLAASGAAAPANAYADASPSQSLPRKTFRNMILLYAAILFSVIIPFKLTVLKCSNAGAHAA